MRGRKDLEGMYLQEPTELCIVLQLVLHPLFREREMSNIVGVSQPELCRRVQEDISNTMDDGGLFALPNIHGFEQPSVAFAQIEDITEDIVYEVVNFAWANDRWVGHPEGTNEELEIDVSEMTSARRTTHAPIPRYPNRVGIASLC